MQQSYHSAQGISCSPVDLKYPLARDLALLLESSKLNWFRLIECRRTSPRGGKAIETVVFEVEPEVKQYRVNDIRGLERIASVFTENELPSTLALRTDFPAIPHINPYAEEFPRSLCLWEESADELRLHWTSAGYLNRVREWLQLSASGELHLPGQSLEPLLPPLPYRLIVPQSLLVAGDVTPDKISTSGLRNAHGFLTITTNWRSSERDYTVENTKAKHTFIVLKGQPQEHGFIRRLPCNLADLHEFALTANINLKKELRTRIHKWIRNKAVLNSHPIIVLLLPKRRTATGPVENTDERAFLLNKPLIEVAKELGFRSTGKASASLTYALDKPDQGSQTPILPMSVTPMLNRESAALFNGYDQGVDTPVVAIGAGALGSQLTLNLARGGFGDWTIVDKDILLPHNMARHAYFGPILGHPKSVFVAHLANEMFDETLNVRSLDADVLAPGKNGSRLHHALSEAKLVLDMSASVAVAHYLSHDLKVEARRVAAFLNPKGCDLIVLAEDQERDITIADLRIQHLRAINRDALWPDHWQPTDERLRYAGSCGDLSSRIPQDAVSIHAATGSRALRRLQNDIEASITVWRLDAENDTLERRQIPIHPVILMQSGRWQVRIANDVTEKIRQWRSNKLPVETGGVLLGSFDTQRSIVYIADALPSPPDSVERRDSYIRGSENLREQVEEIQKLTGEHIVYAGEWHSHPRGHSANPSQKDRQLFEFLSEDRQSDGLPAVMFIAGETDCQIFVENIQINKEEK